MYDFHEDNIHYFNIQRTVTSEYIIPFLESLLKKKNSSHVLEIGCGEAGVLKAFLDAGFTGLGIELSAPRVENAKVFLEKEIAEGRVQVVTKNIYDVSSDDLDRKFDLIVLKDVIEHIPQQEKLIPYLKNFLAPDGIIFFGFPPWQMPFGGHQQVCKNKWLAKLPWMHLLPAPLYSRILKLGGENEERIKELLEVKSTGISIERLHRILKNSNYEILKQRYWLLNPVYKWKFNLRPRVLFSGMARIKYLRNFYTTALYVCFKPKA